MALRSRPSPPAAAARRPTWLGALARPGADEASALDDLAAAARACFCELEAAELHALATQYDGLSRTAAAAAAAGAPAYAPLSGAITTHSNSRTCLHCTTASPAP